ncbi:Fip1 domain-containing protein [Amylocarpus encephaloides]|uniref:Fip1 domain-containing protein n=1 Tax=Amylocarpus encephaloides TaxID=45428 RepID=A0A9P7YFS3_9HELO|nr:Fip1 domain-containing protein [Amylocarpus encephaloides]
MDIDEEDDFYGTDEKAQAPAEEKQNDATPQTEANPPKQGDEDLEEGEEEDEEEDDSDSDIDIITERKDGSKPQPPQSARYNEIRNIPQKTTINDPSPPKPAAPKKEKGVKASKDVLSGANLPGIKTSKIDVYANPIHEASGKHITEVNMEEDLPGHDKPWRRPGTDVSDYFNYGFDEYTWSTYSGKQETNRSEFNAEKMAAAQKKMMEDMNMVMMGGMSSMPGMGGTGQMPTMEGIPAEMQAMMQQMVASGMDPSQMDPAAMFAGMQGGAGAAGAAGGAQAGFGPGQNQGMGYGYDQQQGGAGNRGGGNFGRGGRGGRRNW